ncbi:MAG: UDP-N-acetylglucosamine--N-acetylmuramyl-(pentapeptide) pyrophosphoryl-undecaprenol N-acetylglucosamine transferase [Bdellovibrionota bacterium]
MSNNLKKYNIILTGGGTAGHVWPHFALFEGNNPLAQCFRQQNLGVHYVGSYSGMEKDLVTTTQLEWHYHSISTGKLRRYFSLQNFLDPFKIFYGFLQCFMLIGKVKPSVIFSKGGFVSAPIVWAAWLRGVPVVTHESDATPALATKLTLPFARKGLFAFGETIRNVSFLMRKKSLETGLPIRESLFSASKEEGLNFFKFTPETKVILIFGGSLGAQSLNEKIFTMLPDLIEKYQIIHITGKGNRKEITPSALLEKNYRQFEFLKDEMKYAYAAADLAICRAGASSIFELAAGRIPMILLPLGLHASRGDQIINAQIFSSKGWAQWIDETTFQKETAITLIHSTMNSLDDHKKALSVAPSLDAANKIAEILWNIMLKK